MEKINQEKDTLTNCPCCTSNACYESEFTTQDGPITTWLCMTCGFTSNTTMEEGSDILNEALELTADLIKDLRQIHPYKEDIIARYKGENHKGKNIIWLPTVIQLPDVGMIFPEPIPGSSTLSVGQINWKWTVVKTIDISEEEKEKYPDPSNPGTFYKKRMDMKNPIRFDKLCFMDAAEELGMFRHIK